MSQGSQRFTPEPRVSHSIQVKQCYREGFRGQMNLGDKKLSQDSTTFFEITRMHIRSLPKGQGMQSFPPYLIVGSFQVQHLKTPVLPGAASGKRCRNGPEGHWCLAKHRPSASSYPPLGSYSTAAHRGLGPVDSIAQCH